MIELYCNFHIVVAAFETPNFPHNAHAHMDDSTKAVPQALAHMDDSTVSSLIDQVTKEWSGQLIDHSIAPFIAQNIKAIPLWRTMQEDCLVWPLNRDGNYSVKAGYQLLGDLETREAASGSSRADQRGFWNGIWKLHIPYKIKNFCSSL